jgi:hypothetical protein
VSTYRKFSDTLVGESSAPFTPKAPKPAKADLTGSKETPTLDALGSLGGHAPSGEFCSTTAGAWTDACKVPGSINDHSGGAVAEWAAALARLDPNKPPGDVPPVRWGRFIDDARQFLASDWPRQATELGWTALDLFGCHSIAPNARHDCKGLVWSLGEFRGDRLTAISAETAVIERPTGSRQTFYRRPRAAADVVLPWELRLSEAEQTRVAPVNQYRGPRPCPRR